MKKFTAILLTVIMVASLFTSCSNSIAPSITDETVSVSFDEATSRSLTASLDDFDADDYYWAYKAVKTDSTGLNSGATNFAWVKSKGTGLAGVTIPGFSQGAWEFELYAYTIRATVDESDNNTMAYTGKTDVVLTKGGNNTVSVTVSPISSGNGTLVVDIANIKIKDASGTILDDNAQGSFTKVVTIDPIAEDGAVPESKTGENITTYTYDAQPGAYKVSVGLQQDGITFASGSVVATVYANLTTTVSGTLLEQITDATFDPSRNPDVMNLVASSESIDLADKDNDFKIVFSSGIPEGETEPKVKAEVVAEAGKDLINELKGEEGEGSAELKAAASHEVALALSVDTTSASDNSVSYEINLSSTITSKDSDGNVTATEVYPVSTLTKYLTAKIQLQDGLLNVVVTHNSQEMQKLNSLSETVTNENGAYHYDIGSGLLTIMTKRFSPFEVRYSKFVAEMNGRKFASLQDAIDAATDGYTVVLLDDIDIASPIEVTKEITLDLNEKTITNTKDIWNEDSVDWSLISVKAGNLTITGNGSLIAKANDCYAADLRDDGRLVIENGTFVGNLSAVYVFEGSLFVNGGDFSITQLSDGSGEEQYRYLLNCYDPNYQGQDLGNREYTGPATIAVTGGTFHGFNPANNKAEGTDTNFVADGYFVEQSSDGIYQVKKAPVKKGTNWFATLDAAMNSNVEGEISLLEDTKTSSYFDITSDVTLKLGEKTWTVGDNTKLLDGKNFNVSGGTVSRETYSGYVDVRPGTTTDSVIDYTDVVFDNTYKTLTYGPCTDRVKSALEYCPENGGNATFYFKNCTFNNSQVLFEGLSGKTGSFTATFENCTFNNLGTSAGIEVDNYLTGTITVKDCTFNLTATANMNAIYSSNSVVTWNFEGNNAVNGYAATASGENGTVDQIKIMNPSIKVYSINTTNGTVVNGLDTVIVTGIATK